MPETMYSMFLITIQQYTAENYQQANIPAIALISFIAFVVLAMILMLNIFIAMINSTYSRNIDNKQAHIAYSVRPFGPGRSPIKVHSPFSFSQTAFMVLFLERRLTLNGRVNWFTVGDPEAKFGYMANTTKKSPVSSQTSMNTASLSPSGGLGLAKRKTGGIQKRLKYIQIPVDVSTEQVGFFFLLLPKLSSR